MKPENQKALETAEDCADEARMALQRANSGCGPVEHIVITGLIRDAAALQARIREFRVAVKESTP